MNTRHREPLSASPVHGWRLLAQTSVPGRKGLRLRLGSRAVAGALTQADVARQDAPEEVREVAPGGQDARVPYFGVVDLLEQEEALGRGVVVSSLSRSAAED